MCNDVVAHCRDREQVLVRKVILIVSLRELTIEDCNVPVSRSETDWLLTRLRVARTCRVYLRTSLKHAFAITRLSRGHEYDPAAYHSPSVAKKRVTFHAIPNTHKMCYIDEIPCCDVAASLYPLFPRFILLDPKLSEHDSDLEVTVLVPNRFSAKKLMLH